MSVRGLLVLLAAWTLTALVLTMLWPHAVETPGCAGHVQPSADCLALMDAMNEQNWPANNLPQLAVVVGGYALIVASWALVRRGR